MDPLTAAIVGFTVKAFSDNEEAQKLKNDVFGGFVKWVRPLFVKDDPVAEAVLTQNDTPDDTKATVVKTKLDTLLADEDLKAEFGSWIAKLQAAGIKEKNIVRNADIDVEGGIHIGDTNSGPGTGDYDRKNVVEGGKLKGGSFHLGDKGG